MTMGPSRWWHLLSVMIFLIAGAAAPVAIIISMIFDISSGEDFHTPGEFILKVQRPTEYNLMIYTSVFHDGKQFNFSEKIANGTTVKITNQVTGEEIPTSSGFAHRESMGTNVRTSVCKFKITSPGAYLISVSGTNEKRIMTVKAASLGKFLFYFFIAFIISVAGWILPPIISITVEVKRYIKSKSAKATQPS